MYFFFFKIKAIRKIGLVFDYFCSFFRGELKISKII